MPAGRPKTYDPNYHPKKARQMAFFGLTNPKIAAVFEVHRDTLDGWTKEYPEFSDALHMGRNDDVLALSNSLVRRGHGYKVKEIKKTILPAHQVEEFRLDINNPTGPYIKVMVDVPAKVLEVTEVTKTVGPDPGTLRYILNNRAPNEWREAAHVDYTTNGKDITDHQLDLSKLTDEEIVEMARIERKAKGE